MIMIGINFMSSTDDPYIVRKDFFHFQHIAVQIFGGQTVGAAELYVVMCIYFRLSCEFKIELCFN